MPAVNIELPEWAEPYVYHRPYKSASGGRASSKTWTFAELLGLIGIKRRITAVVFREIKASTTASAQLAIRRAMERSYLDQYYDFQSERIVGRSNDTVIRFHGIETSTESVRGMEDVDIAWVEEAQRMSQHSAEILVPTIRKDRSEIWFSWNPVNRTDWVWRRFVENAEAGDLHTHVTYRDNPWFPKRSEMERQRDQRTNPLMYSHIWEGTPDDAGGDKRVLPYDLLMICLEAYRQNMMGEEWRDENMAHSLGLDIADTGTDWNALVAQRRGVIYGAEKWRSDYIKDSVVRSDRRAREYGVRYIYYDAAGVGAGARSFYRDIPDKSYFPRAEMFGGGVKGPDRVFSHYVKNPRIFRSSQRADGLGFADAGGDDAAADERRHGASQPVPVHRSRHPEPGRVPRSLVPAYIQDQRRLWPDGIDKARAERDFSGPL